MSPLLQSTVPGLALGTYHATDPADARPLIRVAGHWGLWLAGVRYSPGVQVQNAFDGGQYIALSPSLGVRPDTDPSSWYPDGGGGGGGAGVGPWTTPLAVSASIEILTLEERVVRSEGASARFRGSVKVRAGKELAEGAEIMTVRAEHRPPQAVQISVVVGKGTAATLELTPAGVLKSISAVMAAGITIPLDSETWHLT